MSAGGLQHSVRCAVGSCLIATAGMITAVGPAQARSPAAVAQDGMQLFAAHCFSPYLTAARADEFLSLAGVSYDFYDLDPFSSAPPSPVTGRAATPGTDRRCEVSFAGDHADAAADVARQALSDEGITRAADLPAQFAPGEGTRLLAARRLNPTRVAVVHVGLRDTASGPETFMLVERMTREGG